MKTNKRLAEHEPFLNTVARRLGRAAGTLAKVTHEVTGSLSCVAGGVAARVGELAPKQKSKSQTERRARTHRARAVAASQAPKRKPTKSRTNRRRATRS